jgi:hypothetical protein
MPETVVREELEALDICVRGVVQLRSGRRDQDPKRTALGPRNFIVSVAQSPDVTRVHTITQLCGLRVNVESYVAPKCPLQWKRCQHFGHTQRGCGYAPRCVACGEAHLSGGCSTSKEQLKCCSCGGNHTAIYRGCGKWKKAKAALARSGPTEALGKSGSTASARQEPSAEELSLGEGWNHVLPGCRVAKVPPSPSPQPTPTPIAQAHKKAKTTGTSNEARTKKPAPKVPAAPKKAPPRMASTTQCAAKSTLPKQLVPSPALNPFL